MKTSPEVFLKAAKLIEERGFCRGYLRGEDGSLCIQGAVLTALGHSTDNDWTSQKEAMPAIIMLASTLTGNWSSLQKWNDKKGRTKEEAIEFLRNAYQEWKR